MISMLVVEEEEEEEVGVGLWGRCYEGCSGIFFSSLFSLRSGATDVDRSWHYDSVGAAAGAGAAVARPLWCCWRQGAQSTYFTGIKVLALLVQKYKY